MGAKLKNNNELKNEIIDLYNKGLSIRAVADKTNISKSSVHKLLKNEKITRNRVTFNSKEDARGLYEEYQNGASLQELAKMFNVSTTCVRDTLIKWYGIGFGTTSSFVAENVDKIIERYKNGVSVEQICREFDVGKRIIEKVIRGNGVTIRYDDLLHLGYKPKHKIEIYEINLDYFKELDKAKAFTLGCLYVGSKIDRDVVKISFSNFKKDSLRYIVEEVSYDNNEPKILSKSSRSWVVIKNNDTMKLLNKLYGYPNNITIDEKYFNSFLDGLIYSSCIVKKSSVKFDFYNKEIKIWFLNYIKTLGITFNDISKINPYILIKDFSVAFKIINKSYSFVDELLESKYEYLWRKYFE